MILDSPRRGNDERPVGATSRRDEGTKRGGKLAPASATPGTGPTNKNHPGGVEEGCYLLLLSSPMTSPQGYVPSSQA
ncbi:hypothetical protein SAMN02745181_0368 [Rubritalea squalenifaciens DSM 18772]|uniref:Uncharacterized protein n=1 Tax=Rubritalea squalenifaciens DSM 18772 TaxID=1123071 RepID=A0A1M6C281_9BACT|nr:hypothetical protein SAMN02745181_0368 [Rubritalea squalenifaciens DSM 18772]